MSPSDSQAEPRSLGVDERHEWRVVLRDDAGAVVDQTSPTQSRDVALARFMAMAEQYRQWPKEAIQLERREIGEWEVMDA